MNREYDDCHNMYLKNRVSSPSEVVTFRLQYFLKMCCCQTLTGLNVESTGHSNSSSSLGGVQPNCQGPGSLHHFGL